MPRIYAARQVSPLRDRLQPLPLKELQSSTLRVQPPVNARIRAAVRMLSPFWNVWLWSTSGIFG